MFEIAIFFVIVLALGYWVALWLMGRHDDVLHGDFVHPEQALTPPPPSPHLTPPRPDRMDTLQSLLATIKRDLKDASQL